MLTRLKNAGSLNVPRRKENEANGTENLYHRRITLRYKVQKHPLALFSLVLSPRKLTQLSKFVYPIYVHDQDTLVG